MYSFPKDKLDINLRTMMLKVPMSPIIVESTSPDTLDSILSVFDSFGINIYQHIPTFGFVAGVASPQDIIKIASTNEVQNIYFDTSMFALEQPVGPPPSFIESILPSKILLDMLNSGMSGFLQQSLLSNYDGFIQGITNTMNSPNNPLTMIGTIKPPNIFGGQNNNNNMAVPLGPPPNLPFMNLSQMEHDQQFSVSEAVSKGTPIDRVASKLKAKKGIPTTVIRKLLKLDMAENAGITGKGVKVAVLDTGIDMLSSQTPGDIETEVAINYHPNIDANGHGTHVLTTAVGRATINREGIAIKGMAPDAHAIAIKVLGGAIGTGRNSDVLKGIEIAYLKGANIISMSLGSEVDQDKKTDPTLTDPTSRTIKTLTQKGIMFSIAAANSGPKAKTIGMPAGEETAITVGAVNPRDNKVANFSSRGPFYGRIKPDVTCYGVDTYSSTSFGSLLDGVGDKKKDGYEIMSGTSMATPAFTGLLACAKQLFPELDTHLTKKVLEVQGIPKNNNYGWGIATFEWFSSLSHA